LNLIIKLNYDKTFFSIKEGTNTVFLDSVVGGYRHIINDVAVCIRLKPDEAKNRIEKINYSIYKYNGKNKDEKILSEIIESRLENIFESILKNLMDKDFIKNINLLTLDKNDYYINGVNEILSNCLSIKTITNISADNIKL
jgi:cell division ATPase FtsA